MCRGRRFPAEICGGTTPSEYYYTLLVVSKLVELRAFCTTVGLLERRCPFNCVPM